MLSGPSVLEVVDLDRVEARFIPYVQRRQERMLQEQLMAEKQRKLRNNNENYDMNVDGNEVNMNENENESDKMVDKMDKMVVDDDLKKDENGNVVDPMNIEAKAMPNPNLGDVNEEVGDGNGDDIMNKLVDDYKPIQHALPNEDDMKIEQHILDDLDNDDESYLDIDLTKEQDALTNLKGLLASMQMNMGGQNNQESFLSLFKK
eukprot:UN00728